MFPYEDLQVILQMKIKGSDEMSKYTKECGNCGAVIENENATACPYCGHTYDFQKYYLVYLYYFEMLLF